MKYAIWFALFSTVAQAHIYETGVPARARFPEADVNGRIYYQVLRGTGGHRTRNCVLAHGHGITQQALAHVENFDGKSLAGANPEAQGVVGLATAILPPELGAKMEKLATLDVVQAFGRFYYGEYLIGGLLRNACDNVIVIMQESSQSTILEMTVRLERFLRDVACGDVGGTQLGCALVGHSKAGAAATSILRRCAEALPARAAGTPLFSGGSELGAKGCSVLGEVYAASAVNEGVMLPAFLAGSRRLGDRKKEVEKFTFGLIDMNKQFEDGMRKLQPLKDAERKLNIDLFGDKNEDTNPVWFDLSPIAEMDGYGEAGRKTGVPIALRHGPGFVLSSGGWLRKVEYAASGGSFRFDKTKYVSEMRDGLKIYHFDPADTYKISAGKLPALTERPVLIPRGGLGRSGGILGGRLQGLGNGNGPVREALDFLWDPFTRGQHLADELFTAKIGELHGEPQMPITIGWGLEDISRYAKDHALTDKDGKTDFLSRFRMTPSGDAAKDADQIFFNDGDGLVELGSALGVCERGKTAKAGARIVTDCKTILDTHHLGMTGMSMEVADHIVQQLGNLAVAPAPVRAVPAPAVAPGVEVLPPPVPTPQRTREF